MGDPDGTTALVVLVPEAEAAVGALRARHDPSAALGVGAHVTVLYPFALDDAWTPSLAARLAAALRGVAPFDARLRRVARLGDATLCLVPEPAAAFDDLLRRVAAAFPEHPPYGGAFDAVIPHLTVADGAAPEALDAAERSLAGRVDVRSRVAEVTRLVLRGGRWSADRAFPLGG